MIDTTNNTSAAFSTTPAAASAAAAKKGSEVSKDVFMQLLVAQVKNQDPLKPTDGVQFLTQLAQFTELEQMAGMRTDIQNLSATLAKPASAESTGETTHV